jgi:hypothetical protein
MDSAAYRSGSAENTVDLGPIDALRIGGGNGRQNSAACGGDFDDTHDHSPPRFRRNARLLNSC